MKRYADIYFTDAWGALHASKDHGRHAHFRSECAEGAVDYSFIVRDVDIDGKLYYDLITPYGFSGPIITQGGETAQNRRIIVEDFEYKFSAFCVENSIVSEYVRFSPWIKNHLDFEPFYTLCQNHTTIGIDTSVSDIWMDEISAKRRNIIRKAQSSQIQVEFDFEGKMAADFLRIYKKTIIKNNIPVYYFFSEEFIRSYFQKLQGHVFFVCAVMNETIVSIAMLLHFGKYLHYHLSANEPEFYSLNGNSLLLYEAAMWAQRNECSDFMLGGGGNSQKLDGFKRSFTRNGVYDYYVGKRIRQPKIYEELIKKTGNGNPNYFPEYRV